MYDIHVAGPNPPTVCHMFARSVDYFEMSTQFRDSFSTLWCRVSVFSRNRSGVFVLANLGMLLDTALTVTRLPVRIGQPSPVP